MTEKLYYADSHLSVFTAKVLACEQVKRAGRSFSTARPSSPRAAARAPTPGRWAAFACWTRTSAAARSSTSVTRR